jgi:hypothetical protein
MGLRQLNILLMPIILITYIEIVMLKSLRVAGALLVNDVVGLDFDA